MNPTDLSQLPPPPKGQTGQTLQSLQGLPPPPAGQQGMTLSQIQSQPQQTGTPSENIWRNLATLGNTVSQGANAVAGNLGGAIGNSLAGPVGAAETFARTGNVGQSLDTFKVGLQQGAKANSDPALVGRTAGEVAQDVVTPASLAVGGGTGATVGARIGNAALKFGGLGAIAGGANAAAGGNFGQIIPQALQGGALGAAGGAIGQGIGEGIAAWKSPAPATLEDSLKMTQPTLNKKGAIGALENAGRPGGAATEGALGKISVAPSSRDVQVAKSVQDAIQKGDPVGTIANINGKIEDVAENQVRPALQQSPSAFNLKTLNAYIQDNTQIPNYIKADPVLQKTYDLTRESMLQEAAQQPKTLEGLWDARKSFDSVAERQGVGLDPTSEKASVIKQAVLDTRRAVNDFIVENHPNGQQAFGKPMQLLNQMYEARNNIATANYKALGTNAIQRWIKANPTKAKFLEYGAGIIGAGALLGEGSKIANAL